MSRFQAWTLASRARYALVRGGIGGVTVASVIVVARFSEISVGRALAYFLVAVAVNAAAAGLIWYPLEKRKVSTRHG